MVYNPAAMERCQRIAEIITRSKSREKQLRNEQFQGSCRKLAVTLFRKLRAYDPYCCVSIEFEVPLPLDSNSSPVFGRLSASIEDIKHGDKAPFIDYTRFEIIILRENTRSLQNIEQSIELVKSRTHEGWRLETRVYTPGKAFPDSRIVRDPETVSIIQNSVQAWKCE